MRLSGLVVSSRHDATREGDRETETERETQTERETETNAERERKRARERERERERGCTVEKYIRKHSESEMFTNWKFNYIYFMSKIN